MADAVRRMTDEGQRAIKPYCPRKHETEPFEVFSYRGIEMTIISGNIRGLDDLSGTEFECFCARILQRRGYYNIRLTPAKGDFGVDIIAESMQLKFAIQCKRSKNNIGNKAIQEALSGKVYYKCDEAIVVTNRYFTRQAKQTASATGVILWDRTVLLNMMNEARFRVAKR